MIFIPGHYSLKNTVALKRTAKCNGSGAKCLMAALFMIIPPPEDGRVFFVSFYLVPGCPGSNTQRRTEGGLGLFHFPSSC